MTKVYIAVANAGQTILGVFTNKEEAEKVANERKKGFEMMGSYATAWVEEHEVK